MYVTALYTHEYYKNAVCKTYEKNAINLISTKGNAWKETAAITDGQTVKYWKETAP